jgi:para-aminobenzoate synthetase component I
VFEKLNSHLHICENAILFLDIENKRIKCIQLSEKKERNNEKQQFVIIPFPASISSKVELNYYDCLNESSWDLPNLTAHFDQKLKLQAPSKESYIQKVESLKNHIQQGDIYEVNYCIELFGEELEINPLETFIRLQSFAQAPYAALVKLNNEYIISASPELFLKREQTKLISKPIKGTAKRGQTTSVDDELKQQLQTSVKERTENVMIVDVTRNDFSKIAGRGSVVTEKLYDIESFKTVHQMVSTVVCEIHSTTTFETIIHAVFPIPSITGAPKRRATELIHNYESFHRNYYCGTMGLLETNNDFEMSVIIRSIFYNTQTKRVSIGVGSAITYLCDAAQEYDECLLKAEALLNALDAALNKS